MDKYGCALLVALCVIVIALVYISDGNMAWPLG